MPRVVCISRRPKLLRIDLLLVRLETDREIKIFSLPDVPHLPEASPSTLFADGSFELASEQIECDYRTYARHSFVSAMKLASEMPRGAGHDAVGDKPGCVTRAKWYNDCGEGCRGVTNNHIPEPGRCLKPTVGQPASESRGANGRAFPNSELSTIEICFPVIIDLDTGAPTASSASLESTTCAKCIPDIDLIDFIGVGSHTLCLITILWLALR
ncbi:hypothetical protein JMJ76_0005001 [Colletotrichum scovillei]|nr:hypothetical protein JMJ76_0005001 [Colletotrichum scovillei]